MNVINNKCNFPQSAEYTFPKSDEYLFQKFLFDDGFVVGDVAFDYEHEGAYWVKEKVPAATRPRAERRGFIPDVE